MKANNKRILSLVPHTLSKPLMQTVRVSSVCQCGFSQSFLVISSSWRQIVYLNDTTFSSNPEGKIDCLKGVVQSKWPWFGVKWLHFVRHWQRFGAQWLYFVKRMASFWRRIRGRGGGKWIGGHYLDVSMDCMARIWAESIISVLSVCVCVWGGGGICRYICVW